MCVPQQSAPGAPMTCTCCCTYHLTLQTLLHHCLHAQALLEALEARSALPGELDRVPLNVAAEGLWAITRLQLQPSTALVQRLAAWLLEDPNSGGGSSAGGGGRLLASDARALGSIVYAMNFLQLRQQQFWAVAAAAALPLLGSLRPAALANLLVGAAASGWRVTPRVHAPPATAGNPQAQPACAPSVALLLQRVETALTAEPRTLCSWRIRDIAGLAQAYSLTGHRSPQLFAAIAAHLLGDVPPGSRAPPRGSSLQAPAGVAAAAAAAERQSRNTTSSRGLPPWLQQQQAAAAARAAAGPSLRPRLADARATDAVGLAWAFVESFCPHRLLLSELAALLAARSAQLHAADAGRLLWAYAVARVREPRMLAAVTAATASEMHAVLPRTAAAALWALAALRFHAPAFTEGALECLATALDADSAAAGAVGGTAVGGGGAAAAGKEDGSTKSCPGGAGSSSSSSSSSNKSPSVLQQLLHAPPPMLLDTGAEGAAAGRNSELAALSSLEQQPSDRASLSSWDMLHGPFAMSGDGSGAGAQQQQQVQQEQQQVQQQHVQQQQQHHNQQQQQQEHQYMCSHRDVVQAAHAAGRLRHHNAAFATALERSLPRLVPGCTDTQLVQLLWAAAACGRYNAASVRVLVAEVRCHPARCCCL
jgi:hypothetical protein